MDELTSVDSYVRTISALGTLLDDLSPGDWTSPTIEGWSVKDLVAHLIAIEEYFGRQLGLWPLEVEAGARSRPPGHDPGLRRRLVCPRTVADVLARWRELTTAITEHLVALDRQATRQPLRLHYLDTSLSTVLIVRVFEIWTHDEDIRKATGRTVVAPDAERLRRMSRVAVPSMPLGLTLDGAPVAGRTARIVLTGPGGGTWDQALALGEAPGEPETTLVLDVVDYCRLAACRLSADDVAVTVEGDPDLARQVLAGAGVFSA